MPRIAWPTRRFSIAKVRRICCLETMMDEPSPMAEPERPGPSTERPSASTKPCRECGSVIPSSARLCKECKSYQSGWRAVVSVSTPVLALAVALVSVLGSTVPAIHAAAHRPASKLSFGPAALRGDLALVSVTNTGDAPAIVRGGLLYDGHIPVFTLDALNLADLNVLPGSKLIPFKLDELNKLHWKNVQIDSIYAKMRVTESSGKEEILPAQFDQAEFGDMMLRNIVLCEKKRKSSSTAVDCD